MPQIIGVPRETFAGEKRVATVPEVVEKLDQARLRRRGRVRRRRRGQLQRRHLPRRGRGDRGRRAQLWAKSDIVFKVRGPSAEEVGLMREGQTLISFIWPAQNPELMQRARGAQGHRAGDRRAAAHAEPRPEDGRADLHGRHHRLSRRDRGGARLRPLLHRPDHRRRQDAAGQGLHRRRRRRRPGGDRHRRRPGRHRARQRHARRSGRPGRVAGRRVREGRLRGGRLRRRRLRQGDERGLPEGPARDVRQAGEGGGHHHHHRADPRQARAEADHRRDGASR